MYMYHRFLRRLVLYLSVASCLYIKCGAIIKRSIFSQILTIDLLYYRSPLKVSYRVSFVSPNSDLCSASVTAVLYAMSWYRRPRCNGTCLYIIIVIHVPRSTHDQCISLNDNSSLFRVQSVIDWQWFRQWLPLNRWQVTCQWVSARKM